MTIGVLTSGGDAPGMNAAIRAVVRQGLAHDCRVLGIRKGYAGLLNNDMRMLKARDVSDIISRGGTILSTARCKEMRTPEGIDKAVAVCEKRGIDALVVIGGDGSLAGARELSRRGVTVVGIPGTIDLDVGFSDYTIGFDTAVNAAVDAIDRIRDTSSSHERCSIVEVMGRHAGHIALWCGIATGAENILVAEKYDGDESAMLDEIRDSHKRGKSHHLIINAEGVGDSMAMAQRIEAETGVETRATILGYMQRGGSPTARDRVYASTMGCMAVDVLLEGKKNRVIAYRDGGFCDIDLDEALEMSSSENTGIDEYQWKISRSLSTRYSKKDTP
ncbi:MAG: 6-phosphofructokinase [Actinomycetaceae bacterium]|nr:6-phosphofructokinase [Actinomycetaceae bacterium]